MSRGGWVLAGASAGPFLLTLDATATALALPSIRLELGASSSGIQWAQNAYLLVLAAVVATLGRLGDVLGRRTVLLAGLGVFALGAIVCAAAGSIELLVAGRAIQGLGAAAMLAIATLARADDRRPRAIGIGVGIALAAGPPVGGAVVELAGWRWLFWLDVALAATALILVATTVPQQRDSERRIDLAGLASMSTGLTLVVLALVEGEGWGWTSPATLGCFGGGVALLATRVRGGPRGLLPFALVGSFWTVMLLLPQYLDLALGFSTARVGAVMLAVTVPMAVLLPFAARLTGRRTMIAGTVCATLGLLALTRLDGSSNLYDVGPGLILIGLGLGLGLACTPPAVPFGGLAGATVVLAAAGAVFQHVQVDERAAGGSFEGAFAAGTAGASWLLAALVVAGAVVASRPASSAARPVVARTPPPRHRA